MGFADLVDALLAQCAEDAEAVLAAAERRCQCACAEAEAAFDRRRKAALAAVELEVRAAVEAELIGARRAAKRRVLEGRQRAIARVLEAVRSHLGALVASDDYVARLPGEVRKALEYAGGASASIRCAPSLAPLLSRATGDAIAIEQDPALDGFVLRTEEITVDATLSARLDQLRPRLVIEILRMLDEEVA